MISGKSLFSRFPFALLLVTAALLLLYTGSTTIVEATSFNPSQAVTMSNQDAHVAHASGDEGACPASPPVDCSAPGHPDITSVTQIPQTGNSAFFIQSFSFLPAALTVAPDAAILDGTIAGDFNFDVKVGLGNSQCLVTFTPPSPPTFYHATTDRTTIVPFSQGSADTNPPAADGIPNAVQGYPKFLDQSVHSSNPLDPPELVRFWGRTVIFGTQVDVHYLVFAPGSLGLPLALGKPTLTTFNTGDVGGAPLPSALTDSCPLFNSRVTTIGLARDNPNSPSVDESDAAAQPGGSDALQTNPAAGQALFALLIQSERDADNDGVGNSDDTCIFNTNVGTPYTPVDAGDAGESTVGGQRDGIDAACDNTSVITDGNPNTWSASAADGPFSFCRFNFFDDNAGSFAPSPAAGADCDRPAAAIGPPTGPGDGYPNRGDNCPQVNNGLLPDGLTDEDPPDGIDNDGDGYIDEDPVDGVDNRQPITGFSQLDSELLLPGVTYSVDGGPQDDATGDLCDVNPAIPDGHFHQPLIITPKCIGALPADDLDSDGYCNTTEAALGSDGTLASSTPENLAIPTVCSDGLNNDLEDGIDLADTGCQKNPQHDIEIKSLTGDSGICSTGPAATNSATNIGEYKLKLKNNSPVGQETMEVGIMLDALPVSSQPTGTMFPPVPSHKSAGQVTSMTNTTGFPPVNGHGPLSIDGDVDVEWLTKAVVTIGPGNAIVTFKVNFPSNCTGPNVNNPDYLVTVDACHVSNSDVKPLGLFGQADCAVPIFPNVDDGGQDRTNNDAPITIPIDDKTE